MEINKDMIVEEALSPILRSAIDNNDIETVRSELQGVPENPTWALALAEAAMKKL